MNVALLTAAGNGVRMGQDIPKQFIHVNNKPIIIHTMEAFQRHPSIDAISVVKLPAWMDVLRAYASQFNITKLRWVVAGGETGQESIFNGLQVLKSELLEDTIVLVHDGNRCFVASEIISDSLATFLRYGCSVAAIPCVEAVFRSQDDGCSSVMTIPREQLFRTQTPHTYTLKKLIWAYGEAQKRGITGSVAPCTLMRELGETIYFSHGSEKNLKITTKDDLELFKCYLKMEKDTWLK